MAQEPNIISRVTALPTVRSVFSLAAENYQSLKSRNQVLSATLGLTESSILMVAQSAMPVLGQFEKQIAVVDHYSCLGLEKIEQKFPIIKKPFDEIKSDAAKLYEDGVRRVESAKKVGEDQYQSVVQYGYGAVNNIVGSAYLQDILKSVNSAVTFTEQSVDYYLPPTEQSKTASDPNSSLVQRMTSLTDRMSQRIFTEALVQLQQLRERSATAINLNVSISLLLQNGRELSGKGLQEVARGLHEVQTRAERLYKDLGGRVASLRILINENLAESSSFLTVHATQFRDQLNQRITSLSESVRKSADENRKHLEITFGHLSNTITTNIQLYYEGTLKQLLESNNALAIEVGNFVSKSVTIIAGYSQKSSDQLKEILNLHLKTA